MKKYKFLTVAAALTLMLTACGDEETTNTETPAASTTAETSAFPMTVSPLSASGESQRSNGKVLFDDVTLEEQPQRAVVLDFGFLDTLDSLGVEGIVGIPLNGNDGFMTERLQEKYANNADVTDVGSVKEPNLEAIAEAEPDVIFVGGRQISFYEELKKITPNVIFIAPDNESYIDGLFKTVDLGAQIFGKENEAEELKANFLSKIAELKEKAPGYGNTLVAMYSDRQISGFNNDENSRYAYVFNDYGFTPASTDITSSLHGSNFSYESILKVNPEVLLVINRGIDAVEAVKADVENDIIKQTSAYKEGQIVYLDGLNWYYGAGGITTETMKIDEILNELN